MVGIFLLHYVYVYKLYHSDLLMLIYFDSSSGVFFLILLQRAVLFSLKWVENSKYVLLLIRRYLERTDKIAVFVGVRRWLLVQLI